LPSGITPVDEQSTTGSPDSILANYLNKLLLISLIWSKAKIIRKQQQEFEHTVHESPQETGIDAPAWTPALVHDCEIRVLRVKETVKPI